MKKTLLIITGIACITLAGCGNSWNTPTLSWSTTTWSQYASWSFGIENCDKYTKLMDCVMGKVPEAQKEQTQKMYNDAMNARRALPSEQLTQICNTTMWQLETMKTTYKSMGCEF